MFRSILKVASLVAACTLFASQDSHAQDFPGMNIGYMWDVNAAQDQQFMGWAWNGSMAVARQLPDHVTPDQIRAHMAPGTVDNIYGGFNNHYHNMQDRLGAVHDNRSMQIRDQGMFVNPATGMYGPLPVGPGGYHVLPNGYVTPGHHPTDFNNNLFLMFQ